MAVHFVPKEHKHGWHENLLQQEATWRQWFSSQLLLMFYWTIYIPYFLYSEMWLIIRCISGLKKQPSRCLLAKLNNFWIGKKFISKTRKIVAHTEPTIPQYCYCNQHPTFPTPHLLAWPLVIIPMKFCHIHLSSNTLLCHSFAPCSLEAENVLVFFA